MESTNSGNDVVFHQMATYNFDSQIKVSYNFEDSDQDEIERSNSSPQNENITEPVSLSNLNVYSNVSRDDMENHFNPEHGRGSGERNYNNSNELNNDVVQPHGINPHIIPQNNSPVEKLNNIVSRMPNLLSLLTSNENIQMKMLLDTVSENLISIIKCYHYYNKKFLNDNRNCNFRRKYLRYQYYYFTLSYNVSVSILLPQASNRIFIKNFITRTIELANSKFWYQISASNLEHLVYGMIHWTKQKKVLEDRCNNYLPVPPIPSPTPLISPPHPPVLSPPHSTSNVNWKERTPAENRNQIDQWTKPATNYLEASGHQLQQTIPPQPLIPPPPYPLKPPSNSTSNTNWNERIHTEDRNSMGQWAEQKNHQLLHPINKLPPISPHPLILPPQPLNSTSNDTNGNERTPTEGCNFMCQWATQRMNCQQANGHHLQQPINRIPPIPAQAQTTLPQQPITPSSSRISNVNWNERTLTGDHKSTYQWTKQREDCLEANGHHLHQPINRLPPKPQITPRQSSIPQSSNGISNVESNSYHSPIDRLPTNLLQPQPLIPPSSSSISNVNNSKQKKEGNSRMPTEDRNSMCQWSKQRKNCLETDNHQSSHPLIAPPHQPPSNNASYEDSNKKMPANDINAIPLFSYGTPGSEVSISINPAIFKKNQNSFNENSDAKTDDNINTNKRFIQLSAKEINKRRKTIDDTPAYNPINYNPSLSPDTSNLLYSNNTAMQPSTINTSTNNFCPSANQNVEKENWNNECQRPLSRSVSRDSGVGSPTSNYNEYNTINPHCEDNQDSTPIISHVTSMNPNAVLIAYGPCRVCGASTRKKCIGCYQEYYCSLNCQKEHWHVHKNKCKVQ